jgi:hypothetical protein
MKKKFKFNFHNVRSDEENKTGFSKQKRKIFPILECALATIDNSNSNSSSRKKLIAFKFISHNTASPF